ncbi:hypothetical protein HDU96_006058, partial [Phlyctochytrium bullatum]
GSQARQRAVDEGLRLALATFGNALGLGIRDLEWVSRKRTYDADISVFNVDSQQNVSANEEPPKQ